MRKHLKNGNVEKWAGSTIDYWVSIFSSSFLLTTNFRKPNQNDFWNHSAELYSVVGVSEPEQPVMAHTFHSCFLSFMEVSFVYLAYEGTQFGAEKMVLFS